MIAKGVQGVYEPIESYLTELDALCGVLLKLLDVKALLFTLQVTHI
jgi:hypothetical protein